MELPVDEQRRRPARRDARERRGDAEAVLRDADRARGETLLARREQRVVPLHRRAVRAQRAAERREQPSLIDGVVALRDVGRAEVEARVRRERAPAPDEVPPAAVHLAEPEHRRAERGGLRVGQRTQQVEEWAKRLVHRRGAAARRHLHRWGVGRPTYIGKSGRGSGKRIGGRSAEIGGGRLHGAVEHLNQAEAAAGLGQHPATCSRKRRHQVITSGAA